MKSTHKQTQSCCQGYLKGTRQAVRSGEAFGLGSLVWRWHFVKALCITSKGLLLDQQKLTVSPTQTLSLRYSLFLSALRGHINIIFSGNLFMAFLSPQRASAQLLERDCQNSSTWHTFPSLTFHTVSVFVSVPLLVCFPCNLYVCNIYVYIYAYIVDFTNVFGLFALDAFSRPSDCLKSSPPTEWALAERQSLKTIAKSRFAASLAISAQSFCSNLLLCEWSAK